MTMNRKNTKNSLTIVPGEDLHPVHIARIIKASEEYTRQVNESRIVYPDPDTIDFSAPNDDINFDLHPRGFLTNVLGITNRAKKAAKGGGGGQPKLPNPQTVLAEVRKYYEGVPVAGMTGNLVLGELNVEFGDASKAKYFREAFVEIVSHLHTLAVEEVDSGWVDAMVQYVKEVTGVEYKGFTSVANTRNQAVGILIHPRLKVLSGPTEYMEIATVQGVPDLRPAYRVDLQDTVTGAKFSKTVVHLKSMRGGPAATSAVRYKQLDILQRLLGKDYSGFIVGDLNFILTDKTLTDSQPLTKNGYELFMPNDTTGTHAMGSRIDGWFYKNLDKKFGVYKVRRFFANPQITRAFTDHGQTEGQLILCETQLEVGKPNIGCPGGPDASSQPSDVNPA